MFDNKAQGQMPESLVIKADKTESVARLLALMLPFYGSFVNYYMYSTVSK